MEGFHRWRGTELRGELTGSKFVQSDLGMVGMETRSRTSWPRHACKPAVLWKAHRLSTHLINVRRGNRMRPTAIPSVRGHDVVNACLLELIKDIGLDIPELCPPTVLPDPVALFRQRQIRQRMFHKRLHGPDFTPVEHLRLDRHCWYSPFEMLYQSRADKVHIR